MFLIFQSTFPRGERRIIHVVLNTIYYISIHVPAWGTTFKPDSNAGRWVISIHVPAWGTTVLCGLTGGKVGFQSTFPRGERRDSVTCHPLNIAISIHVPAWGTTSRIKTISGLMTISIHVPAWGTTQKLSGVEFDYTKFQSTFPRGERPWSQKVLLIFW